MDGHEGENESGLHDETTVIPRFHRRKSLEIVRILIRDDFRGIDAPPTSDFSDAMRRTAARLPIANNAVEIYIVPGLQVHGTNLDLGAFDEEGNADTGPFKELLDEIAHIASENDDNGKIWAGIITDHPEYHGIGGIARIVDPYVFGKAGAESATVFAHEFTHTLGVLHSPCGVPNERKPDPNLTVGHIEDQGMDLENLALVPSGTIDLMCGVYLPGRLAWPSIQLWNLLFDRLA